MKKLWIVVTLAIFLVACISNEQFEEGLVNFPGEGDTTSDTTMDASVTTTEADDSSTSMEEITTTLPATTTEVMVTTSVTTTQEEVELEDESAIVITEGDLLKLNLRATDPDSNPLTYTYSSPLNADGEWDTVVGDAGKYNVIVTASDGQLSTTQSVSIVVLAANKAPVIENLDELKNIVVEEGETVYITPKVNDPDGDKVVVSYSGFMTTSMYKTDYDDAGVYDVTIHFDDSVNVFTEDIKITIMNKNRAPTINLGDYADGITATEGDKIELAGTATDPDGDDITLSYSEPFDNNGVWQTVVGDAGTKTVTISAVDGEDTVTEDVVITILSANKAPSISIQDDVTVKEGQTVVLSPVITDADGDEIVVSYSGWMTTNIKETGYDDAGEYTVVITADDGKTETAKSIKITVENQNRPPENLEIEVIVVPGEE